MGDAMCELSESPGKVEGGVTVNEITGCHTRQVKKVGKCRKKNSTVSSGAKHP